MKLILLGPVLLKTRCNLATDAARSFSGGCFGAKAGAIKDAGGIFNKRGDAQEGQFFRKKERELLQNLKEQIETCKQDHGEKMKDQMDFHSEQIKIHQEAIEKLKTKKDK